MSTSVILLACEEGENLKILLPQIKKIFIDMKEEYEILVIDSAKSLDNTKEICTKNGVKYIPQEQPYFGGAYRTGIKYASKSKILNLDVDLSHDPSTIPKMFEEFNKGYDIVIGSRYIKGGVSHSSKISYLMSIFLNSIMRFCLGIYVKDMSTSYRLYDAIQLKSINTIRNNYDIQQEIILRIKINNRNLRLFEVPIEFKKRKYGKSKHKLFKFIYDYLITLCMLIGINIFETVKYKLGYENIEI